FERLENLARTVGAAIVDEDDLLGDGHLFDAADHFRDPALLVVDRDDDREFEMGWNRIEPHLSAGGFAEQTVENFEAFLRRAWGAFEHARRIAVSVKVRPLQRRHLPILSVLPRAANQRRDYAARLPA